MGPVQISIPHLLRGTLSLISISSRFLRHPLAFGISPDVSDLEAERDCKGQSSSDLVEGMAIDQRVAIRNIERKLVTDLPDQSDKSRNRLLDPEILFVKEFRDKHRMPFFLRSRCWRIRSAAGERWVVSETFFTSNNAGIDWVGLPQGFRADRDSKLTYFTAWIASFVRVPCR
jgi:hypothetical protein